MIESTSMIDARVNILDINCRKKYKNKDIKCELSDYELEHLEHFLLHCEKYPSIRQQHQFVHQPYRKDREQLIVETLLLKEDNSEHTEEK